MPATIRAITLDLDGTLLDSPADDRAAAVHVARECLGLPSGKPLQDLMAAYVEAHASVWAPVLAAPPPTNPDAWDPRRILREIWGQTLRASGLPASVTVDDIVETWLTSFTTNATRFPDVDESVQELRKTHRLAIITNGTNWTQHSRIERSGFYHVVEHVSIAGEKGFGKPRSEIFEETLSCLGVKPEEAVHVGDSLSADIAGARNAGMRSVWINRSGAPLTEDAPRPDASIRAFSELPGVIRSFAASRSA